MPHLGLLATVSVVRSSAPLWTATARWFVRGALVGVNLFTDGLMSVRSAAKWLDVSRTTLWRMMDSGTLPFVYEQGRGSLSRRIPRKALVDWASKRLIGAAVND